MYIYTLSLKVVYEVLEKHRVFLQEKPKIDVW